MRAYKTILLAFQLFFSLFAFGQSSSNSPTKMIGKWLLVKHTILENGKLSNKLTTDEVYTYEFNRNGSYKVVYKDNKYGMNTNMGKWKIVGNKIRLYNITDVPDDLQTLISDHTLPIVKLTTTEFVTSEHLFSEGQAGTSYYTKKK